MNIFQRTAIAYLKKNKTRTIVTIVGIILSAAMICAVTSLVASFANYALETALYTEGNWHGRQLDVPYSTFEEVADSDKVEQAVYLQRVGYAAAEGCANEFKPYIYILGAGDGADAMLPIRITAGHYPVSADEILLPEHLRTNGGVDFRIGDTITLDIGDRILDGIRLTQDTSCYKFNDSWIEVHNGETLQVRESRTYTIAGTFERLSYTIEKQTAPGYTAITLADAPSDGSRYDLYLRMNKPKDVYGFFKDMGFEEDYNTDVLLLMGVSGYDTVYSVLNGLAAIIILLIIFGSVSLIYNAFSISVSERTKQFGLLSSIGATKKQLRRMVLFEAFAVSAIGIPLGILAGIGGIGITLHFIGDNFRSMFATPIDMHMHVSPASVLIATVVALITALISAWIPSTRATKISAIEAIRQSTDIHTKAKTVKTPWLSYKLFGLSGVLAQKNYKRSRKKYRATVLSLFMSIVLFVSASSFCSYLTDSVEGVFSGAGYDITMHIDDSELNMTPDELLRRISSSTDVTAAAYGKITFLEETMTKSGSLTQEGLEASPVYYADGDMAGVNTFVMFVDNDTYVGLLEQYGLDRDVFFDADAPVALAADTCTSFNYNEQRYDTIDFLNSDEAEFVYKTPKVIEGYTYAGEFMDSSGELMVHYHQDGYDDTISGSDETGLIAIPAGEAYDTGVLRCGKVLDEAPYFMPNNGGVTLIYPMQAMDSVAKDYVGTRLNFYITSDDHAASYAALETVLIDAGLTPGMLRNHAEEAETSRNIVLIIRVFSYGFIILISLIAAANVFNTITTNIGLRRREFAMLKSIGLTNRGFNRMMNYECLLYGCRALLLGLPASCAIAYLIHQTISGGYETRFSAPWDAMGIAMLSVFAVVFATMMYAMRRVKKQNPIDALKSENF